MERNMKTLLMRDSAQNCYMIYRLEQGAAEQGETVGNSVRFRDKENGKILYAAAGEEEFQQLYRSVQAEEGLMLSLLTDGRLLPKVLALDPSLEGELFYQLMAPGSDSLKEAELPGVSFGPVEDEHIPWILDSYQHPELCEAFVRRRREAAPAIVAQVEGKPVGFAMTHCGAELGPVYVTPSRRGSGLAGELMRRLLLGMEQRSLRAAVYVREENQRSLQWMKKLGFTVCPQKIAWFWRREKEQ